MSSILTPEPTPNVCDVGQHFQQYQASCYLFVSQPMNWTDATAKCSTKGASLTSINSPYEQAFIFLMLRQQHSIISAIWTGLNDRQVRINHLMKKHHNGPSCEKFSLCFMQTAITQARVHICTVCLACFLFDLGKLQN